MASEPRPDHSACPVHPLIKTAKDAEAEAAPLRAAVEEYLLWQPGRRGHAAAHQRLREALNGDDRG